MSSIATEIKPPPQPAKTITVKVDGLVVEVPRMMPHPVTGKLIPTTMIQACEAAKVKVPHYCYHPKLPVAGNCRMCLVEYGIPALGPDRQPLRHPDGSAIINRAPNPAIACATPIIPGMEIHTNSPGAQAARRAVLEFMLINHPLDCPICDQAGECKLQEYSLDHGQTQSRFAESKVHKPKQVELGPRIMLDDERCILCSRCIRFIRDIVGDDALGFINRGSYNTLAAYPGRPFDNNYSLNTVDLCPVGALTSKDFRFQMRVWFLKETKSICASCGAGCNIIIGVRENKIHRCTPRENDGVNSCWMCDAGRLNYRWIGRPDRLVRCAGRKVEGGLLAGSWPAILQEIVNQLKKTPEGSAAIVASARQTNEELYLLRKLAAKLNALTDSAPRLGEGDKFLVSPDKNPNSAGAKLIGMAAEPMGANLSKIAEGIARGEIRTLIVFGEDITRHLSQELLGRLDLFVVSDVLPNATTPLAHYLLPGCAYAEKGGTFTNIKGRVQKFTKAVEPPGQARPEWEFLVELVSNLTGERLPGNIEGLFRHMAAEAPAFKNLTWASLGDAGITVAL